MSIFDRLRKSASDVVEQHGDKISKGIDRAAKAADERTGGKHSDKIRKGVGKAKKGLDRLDQRKGGGPRGGPSGGTRPPGTTPPESGPDRPPGEGPTPPR